MLQFVSFPLKIELISDTNAQLIQNSITTVVTIKIKKEREKNEKGKTIDHMTERKRRQNRMLQRFFAKLNGSMKLLRSEHPRIIF